MRDVWWLWNKWSFVSERNFCMESVPYVQEFCHGEESSCVPQIKVLVIFYTQPLCGHHAAARR